jgi:hypothetical protein
MSARNFQLNARPANRLRRIVLNEPHKSGRLSRHARQCRVRERRRQASVPGKARNDGVVAFRGTEGEIDLRMTRHRREHRNLLRAGCRRRPGCGQ